MAIVLKPSTASLSHLRDLPLYQDEIPYEIWADNFPADQPRTNVQNEIVHGCALTDVRELNESRPHIEQHGFEWISSPFPTHTGITSVDDIGFQTQAQQQALQEYLASISDLLRGRFGCQKVLCWDWRVRRSRSTVPREAPNIYSLKGQKGNELRATKINSSHLIHSGTSI